MQKKIIAVDVDDVLSKSAQGFAEYSNREWGHSLTADDFDEDWMKVWGTTLEETRRRAIAFHNDEVFDGFRHFAEAVSVLARLKKQYKLVIATSRRVIVENITRQWVDHHYAGLFEGVYFTGIYDTADRHRDLLARTKNDLLLELGANYLIDDQLKHCLAAKEHGVEALLFGDYRWNQFDGELPSHITRCKDWAAVEAYFAGRG
ncbi:MAG: hypothetical protein WBO35_00150 [Candidatus Saccharimonadales bacterium]|jgi:uncharacterized HAD superfamily protein